MSFGAPAYLLLLALVPLAAAFLVAFAVWRARARARLGAPRVGWMAWAAPVLLLAAAGLAAFAAARPQFGEREVRVEERGIDMVIVLDVSQSMYARDADPSRLERAQAEIVAMLDRMQGDRVGMVVFAGTPFVRSPLTGDLQALRRITEGVHEERGLVAPGSDLGTAVRRAREVALTGDAETKALLIVSDGEDHGRSVPSAVAEARAAGIRVFTAGVGTAEGAPVLDLAPDGTATPRVDASGAPVLTRLDAAALREIAAAGNGSYVELRGDGRPLTGVVPALDALSSTTFEAREDPQRVERFAIFASAALALVAVATIVPALVPAARRRARSLWPLAAAGLLVAAVCGSDAASVNRRGNRYYSDGEYARAVDAYRTAEALDPGRGELYHNAGNALDRMGDFASAIDETSRGLPATDRALAAKLQYALGKHYAGAGRLEDAREAFKRALLADPADEDAKHNLELVEKQLRAVPTRTPTPPPVEGVPTPGGTPGGEPSDQTPADGEPATPGAEGTPGAGEGTPGPPDRELTPEEAQRALEEALRGIDEDFTVEEALRVLDLLQQRNRDELSQPREASPGAPDY